MAAPREERRKSCSQGGFVRELRQGTNRDGEVEKAQASDLPTNSPGEELASVETAGAKVLRWEVGAAEGTVVWETEGLTPKSPKP